MRRLDSLKPWLPAIETGCLLLVMAAVLYARCQSVAGYPVHDDELISFAVLRSIVAEGLPLTAAGEVYWRAFPTYYLMALPLLWLEPGLLAFRLVPILSSVLVLPAGYWLCRRAQGRLAAWVAVAFLALSTYQNLFAALSRFYLPFQLFFLAGLYCAGRWLIEGRSRAGWGLWACALLAVGAHHFAVMLAPAALLAWLSGRRPALWKNASCLAALLLLAAWCWLNWLWQPENMHTGSLARPLILGGLRDKLVFVGWFRNFTPGGITLLILGLYPLLRERRPWWLYLYASFAVCLVTLSLLAPADNPRYLVHLYPLGVALCSMALAWWLAAIYRVCRQQPAARLTRWGVVAALVVLAALGYAATRENLAFAKALGTHVKFSDQKPAHDYMSMMVPPGARIMSTDPSFTGYYLGRRVDYWLREQYDAENRRFLPFPQEHKKHHPPEYFIDSPEKLIDTLNSTQDEIWLYVNQKFDWGLSPETQTIVSQHFRLRYKVNNGHVLYRPGRKPTDADPLP